MPYSMKVTVIIEKDKVGFSAYTEGLQTILHGSGTTVDEAKEELMLFDDFSFLNISKFA